MAARSSPFDSQGDEHWTDNSPSRPLSGPGTSRQARRLQLRNAGFRGAAIPTRKVTPKSTSTSTSGVGVSDAENVSPAGARSGSLSVSKRQSSGVLQEIGNSTVTRPKKARPRITSAKLFAAMNTAGTAALGDEEPLSPPPPKTSIRARSTKTRAKMSNKRRSVSAEMGKYIDHLEMELAAAQAQVSAMTSPTVTREQSFKVRNLNAEAKQLQQELNEWEAKYEQRVQEALDEHVATENGLRNRIRALEEDAAVTQFDLQELRSQLDDTNEKMAATETANVHLEKRLEIMGELLAASPTKIDLHAETPGRRRRQQRPQSMLPRFPTASSLNCSPERQSATRPASPMLSFAAHSPSISFSPTHELLRLDHSPQPSDAEQTDAESVFSDVLGATDSITSVETSEAPPAFNPWSLPPVRESRSKPARRMRRFGAGSMGPKPLILPSTSACEQHPPSSAPALERSETTPAFFPQAADNEDEELDLPVFGRRRASTTAGEIRVSSLEDPPPFLELPQQDEGDESMLSVLTPHVDHFRDASRDFSSLGSRVGRNLMEELSAMKTEESGDGVEESEDVTDGAFTFDRDGEPTGLEVDETALIEADHPPDSPATGDADTSLVPTTSLSSTQEPTHARTRSRSTAHNPNLSILDRLRLLFADLWRSPVALAKHLVQTAQSRMRIPSPLLNAQWWLVGILLGPMARRRMLSRPRSECCANCEGEDSPLLLTHHEHVKQAKDDDDKDLAYGSFHPTPPSSPHRSGSLTGPGKKRAVAGKTRCCAHHLQQRRGKHSPLMWLKFSLTLAFAVGAAFKDGPGSLLRGGGCGCWVKGGRERGTIQSL